MANDYKDYGGSNQIAKLPYKTIDALQQLGLYATKNETDLYIKLNSDLQNNDPDYSCELNAFDKISCNTLDTSTIKAYDILVKGKSIYRDFFQTIKISKNLAMTNSFTNEEVSKIVGLDQNDDRTYLLYDGSGNIVLVRDITILNNQILSMKGVIITDGDKLGTTNIKQWLVKNSAWKAPIPLDATKMYRHEINIRFGTSNKEVNYVLYSSDNTVITDYDKFNAVAKPSSNFNYTATYVNGNNAEPAYIRFSSGTILVGLSTGIEAYTSVHDDVISV